MRIRSVKPEFWTDKRVASWDHYTRLFYIGLWSAADDHGRGSAEPSRLAAELFPYDLSRDTRETLAKVSEALARLSDDSRITVYEVDGEVFFEISKWAEHQRVDRPGKSRIPLPSSPLARPSRAIRETLARDTSTEQGTGSREQGAGICKKDATQPSLPLAVEAPASEPRKRNLVFDATCRADGANPSELTRIQSGRIAKAAADIKRAMPGMSEEQLASEIDTRAEKYKAVNPWKKLTAMALAGEWGSLNGESHAAAPLTTAERQRLASIDSDLYSFKRQTAPDPDQIARRTSEIARLESERAALLKGRTP